MCTDDRVVPTLPRVAVFFVGNRLQLDDGAGPALYDLIEERFTPHPNVSLFDAGCLTAGMAQEVGRCDVLITVDCADQPGERPGTIFRYRPDDLRRREGGMVSLHDMGLADLFDIAALMGYRAEGLCLGVQAQNRSPAQFVEGLTPEVHAALPRLFEALSAELAGRGVPFTDQVTGRPVTGPVLAAD
ncbi:hydrogenase maturation protease [Eggerthellaceae bacterium zg-997]|nr:hydrogenase maturation protease [Eggerthellaceae bacterium zg-997]